MYLSDRDLRWAIECGDLIVDPKPERIDSSSIDLHLDSIDQAKVWDIETFQKAGARIIEPSCGACINAGPGVSTRPDQVVISAQNRNFPGRSGPGQMYLASPYTVAASAVAGYITEYQPTEEHEPALA